MAEQKHLVFNLTEGFYSLDFIRALSMAAHLKLVQPSELTFWFDSGKTKDFITRTLYDRVIANRKNR